MTVGELIEVLSIYPRGYEVLTYGYDERLHPVSSGEIDCVSRDMAIGMISLDDEDEPRYTIQSERVVIL